MAPRFKSWRRRARALRIACALARAFRFSSGVSLGRVTPCHLPSFDILYLLADLFQLRFGFHDPLGYLGVAGFGSDGIPFAMQFLYEEIHLAAYRPRLVRQALQLPQVTVNASQFL